MVYLFLTNGFETVEALTVVDLLRRAKIDITTVSIEATKEVTSSLDIKVIADKLYDECDFSDLNTLVLPGGPGHMGLFNHIKLATLIKDSYNSNKLICAICAAPVILSKLGIDVESTIFPSMTNEIKYYIPENVCVRNNVITGNALGASIDFSLAIIEYMKDKNLADTIASQIVYKC